MYEEFQNSLRDIAAAVLGESIEVEISRPEEKFGDYSTNMALKLAGKLGKNPREVAEIITQAITDQLSETVAETSIAGPGFINFKLKDHVLIDSLSQSPRRTLEGKVVVSEYSDPNPFKVLHVGHLYTSIVGDSISNLLEQAGAEVHRVNFGGDVGLHVGKTMWAIIQNLGGEFPDKLDDINSEERSEWMAERYVEGSRAYDSDHHAKEEIIELNKRVYALHNDQDHESNFAKIYWKCRQWSYEYFDQFYARIGSGFERYYPESETAPIGLATVREQLQKGVYNESDGAVVFDGEKYGLHTRVFINSEGLPTYEAKDVGLILKKWQDYKFDKSVVITGNEIDEYMKVVLKSIEQFMPDLVEATNHLTHGMVKLPGGVKMGSRLGNFIRAVDVLDSAKQANIEQNGQDNQEISLGAVKYSMLKHRMGGDLIYDAKESVSLEGNSGPYLQYAHARARSILRKVDGLDGQINDLDDGERSLVLKISQYNEVIDQAVAELMPHHLCTYLYELTQTFNRFYEANRVLGDDRQQTRLLILQAYADKLNSGLALLGIAAPEQM